MKDRGGEKDKGQGMRGERSGIRGKLWGVGSGG